jgi:hypothetical protein
MDILAELTSLKADYTAAQSLLTEAQALKTSFDSQLAEKETALNTSLETIAAGNKAISDLTLAITGKDKEISDLQALVASLKKAEVTAETKAVEMVAAQGIAPVKVEAQVDTGKPSTRAEVLAEWDKLTSAKERSAFYMENKAIINGK